MSWLSSAAKKISKAVKLPNLRTALGSAASAIPIVGGTLSNAIEGKQSTADVLKSFTDSVKKSFDAKVDEVAQNAATVRQGYDAASWWNANKSWAIPFGIGAAAIGVFYLTGRRR